MNELPKVWPIITSEGILFLILGTMAIIMPTIFSFGIVITIGILLLMSGFIKFFRTIGLKMKEHFWASMLFSITEILLGIAILAYPGRGLMFLTALLIAYFILAGVDKIILAFNLKQQKGWWWIFISGLLSLIFSFILIYFWTSAVAFTLGILFGVNMIFFGFALIFAGTMIRSVEETFHE